MKKLATKLLIVAGLVLGGFAFAAVPANAAPAVPAAAAATPHVNTVICFCDDTKGPKFDPDKFKKYLSAERWRDATSTFHGRFDQFLQNDFIALTQRSLTQGGALATGNALYSTSEGFLGFAMDMQPIQQAGRALDNAAGTIAGALFSNSGASVSIVLVIVIGVVISAFFTLRKGGRPWKRLGGVAVVIGLLSLMMFGATKSVDGPNGDYQPGFGSPGWFATSINDVVSQVANAPVSGMLAVKNGESRVAPTGSGCAPYMKNLSATYLHGAGPTASVNSVLSSLWEDSGLTIWKEVQYGTTKVTGQDWTYGDDVFCHQLDWNANISAQEQATTTFGAVPANFNAKSYAWGNVAGAVDNNVQDQSLIAWASCKLTLNGNTVAVSVKPGWDKKIQQSQCQKWWDGDTNLDAFNVGGASTDADQWDDPAVVDFIHHLHGNDYQSGSTLAFVYALAALGVFVVFCGFAVAIAIAKFAGLVMMVAVMFVLIAQLLTNQEGTGKLVPFLKSYVGFSVLAFGANFLLALITMMSRTFGDLGNAIFAPGDLMALVWSGFAPLLSVIVLHLVLTKVLKMPAVFKPGSAMAWGQSGGGIGNAAGSMFNRQLGAAGRVARRLGRKATDNVADRVLSPLPGSGKRRGGGRGGMNAVAGGGGGNLAGLRKGRAASTKEIGKAAKTAKDISKASNGELRKSGVKLDKRVVRDARWFARGKNPAEIPEGKLGRIGHATKYFGGKGVEGAKDGFKATVSGAKKSLQGARAMADAVRSGEAKVRAGEYAKAVGTASKGAWDNVQGAANYFASNPMDATRRALDVGGSATVAAAKVTKKVVTADATKRVMRAALPTAAGLVTAGPVGAAAGAVVGIQAHTRHHQRQTLRKDAQRVLDYQSHLDTEAKKKRKDKEPKPQPS